MKPGDLALYDPDVYAAGFPHEYFLMLREEDPVHWQTPPPAEYGRPSGLMIRDGFFAITRHEDVVHVSRNPGLFSSWQGGITLHEQPPDRLEQLRNMMISMDPPAHGKYRKLVNRGFAPRVIDAIEPAVRAYAAKVVDSIAPAGSCEFVTAVARELPLALICELMGFPAEDRDKIFAWSNRVVGIDDPEYQGDVADGMAAAAELYLYASEIAAQKRARPDETLVSKLVNGEVDGERISEGQFNAFILLLAVAGNETTRTATSHGIRLLSQHPEERRRLIADLERYTPTAVEEILRFAPPVIYFRRTATEDTELRGVKIAVGQKLVLFYPSANRDAAVFAEPDRFDVGRDPNPHLSFGIGEHYCLGANLARLQLHCIFRELLSRLPDIEVIGAPRLLRGNLIAGIKEMRVRFTPAGAPPGS